ncbi:multifunctional methyltransferase subunit TRM112-like protein isoform X1 [Zootermopsis nevadensis]|uniref:multifunctional methyltransferase subunit TRM112-like protein isoform X1 n=1 Tax=Zootermopsis nevadensis TaxID=136037 RepID=UPI000B8E9F02|nr:multifunctional methyltransferase subunit TRM112-like protein isoform X1 [Zootermopsis nevadensis]
MTFFTGARHWTQPFSVDIVHYYLPICVGDGSSVCWFCPIGFSNQHLVCTSMTPAKDVKVLETEFNSEFVSRIIPKLDWDTLWNAADSIGHAGDLPRAVCDDYENDVEFLKKVHHVLVEVEVIEGELVCPESGRKFSINKGIPNMLLNEDEL